MAVGVVQGLFASALKTGFWFHFIQSNQNFFLVFRQCSNI